jgi:hypothetical protein
MAEIGVFTPEQARLVWQDYQTRQQLAPQINQNFPQRRVIDEPSPHRVFVRNDSGETIPAYGCMRITGTATVSGRTVVTVDKPDGSCTEYMFNSQFAIAAIGEDSPGLGWGYRFGIVSMLGDAAASFPAAYAPVDGSWEVTEQPGGPFIVFGECLQGDLIGKTADSAKVAWEIEAELQDSLLATDPSGVADFVSIRSAYPHVIRPPETIEDGEVQFENPWRLDAICGSKVVLQRIASFCGEESSPTWEVCKVELYKARWIKVRYTTEGSGSPDVLDYWNGEDPESCGAEVTVEYPLGEPCIDADVIAFYDPFTDTYQAISSESAMLGPAETMDIVQAMAFDGCSINFVKQQAKVFPCGSEPDLITISPEFTTVDVLTGADFEYSAQTCDTTASWSWNEGTSTWDVVTPCESGCTATSPPTLPPGPWNDFAVSHESPCTRQVITGLQFAKAVVDVCSFATTSPDIIPITNCPPPEEP